MSTGKTLGIPFTAVLILASVAFAAPVLAQDATTPPAGNPPTAGAPAAPGAPDAGAPLQSGRAFLAKVSTKRRAVDQLLTAYLPHRRGLSQP